jgi:hypothetical protein
VYLPAYPLLILLPAAPPTCTIPSAQTISLGLSDSSDLSCAMRSNPMRPNAKIDFSWSLNATADNGAIIVDVPRASYSERGMRSRLTYTARDEEYVYHNSYATLSHTPLELLIY